MLGASVDLPGTDDDIAVVEHSGLPGRNPVARHVEGEAEPATGRLHTRRHRHRPVAQLRLGALDRDVQTTGGLDGRACEGRERSDDDAVRARIRAQRVQRLSRGDAEALPLAGREAPMARVAAELTAGLVQDRAVGGLEAPALEERAIVVPREKARLLALAARRNSESRTLGLGARLCLRLLAEREDDAVELRGIELRKHVGLILLAVDRSREQAQTLVVDDARVVTRGERVGAGVAHERDEPAEAEGAVAAHARVRRLA